MKRARGRTRVAILGCGAVGRALALELLRHGSPVRATGLWVWSRRRRSVSELRTLLARVERGLERRARVLATAESALVEADVLVLSVGDGGLAPLVQTLARGSASLRGKVVLFTNGWWPVATLAPLRRRGCAVARFHPLAPIPRRTRSKALSGIWYALEGDPRALAVARELVRAVQGGVLELRPEAARGYHAGASLLGGGLVALLHLAEQVMSDSVRSPVALREALADFAGAVLQNARRLGPEQALTGALARGSQPLVKGHLRALRRHPDALLLYRWLGGPMLELARERGSIDARTKRQLLTLLKRDGARARLRAHQPRFGLRGS